MAVASQLERQIRMNIWKKVLAVSCLCAATSSPFAAYADASKSVHEATLVAAPADYENIAVSQVSDYVNIREQATTNSKIVGKIYNNCAATILETVEGEGGSWYRIQSGTVNGFIKSQYFITGQEAETLAQSIGREFVTVSADNLRLREEPNLTSNVLTMVSSGSRYVVQGDEGDFYKVEVDADLIGYIAKSYCQVEVEFDQAVSLEEERQKLEEEAQRKRDAQTAIANLEQTIKMEENKDVIIAANPSQSDDSAMTSAPTANNAQSSQSQSSSAGQSRAVSRPEQSRQQAGGLCSGKDRFFAEQFLSERLQPDRIFRSVCRYGIFTGCRSRKSCSSRICDQNSYRGLCETVFGQSICLRRHQPDKWRRLLRLYPVSFCSLWYYDRKKLKRSGGKGKRNFHVSHSAGRSAVLCQR